MEARRIEHQLRVDVHCTVFLISRYMIDGHIFFDLFVEVGWLSSKGGASLSP